MLKIFPNNTKKGQEISEQSDIFSYIYLKKPEDGQN